MTFLLLLKSQAISNCNEIFNIIYALKNVYKQEKFSLYISEDSVIDFQNFLSNKSKSYDKFLLKRQSQGIYLLN